MNKTEKTCPYCRGTGQEPKDQTKTCPVCRGKKIIRESFKRSCHEG